MLRFLVHEMDIAALHPSGKKNSVGVLHQAEKLVPRSLHNSIVRLPPVLGPLLLSKPVQQILAEYDAHIIELKALRGIDAADLVDAPRMICPQRCLWNALRQPGSLGSCIPGPSIIANYHVLYQCPIRPWLRPFPTETGSHTCRMALR